MPNTFIVHDKEHRVSDVLEGEFLAFESVEDRMMAKVRILKAAKSKNNRIYRASAVKEAVENKLFDGTRMFIDHDTKNVPIKRKMSEMVSAIESTEWNEEAQAMDGTVEFFSKDFYDYAQRAKKYMGVSINALVQGDRYRRPDGVVEEDIKSITTPRSVDWVIYPAAGGEILAFEEEEGENVTVDWSAITVDELKKNAPEVWTAIESELKVAEPDPKDDEGDEDEAVKLTPSAIRLLVSEGIQEYVNSSTATQKKREDVSIKVSEKMKTSGLPEKTRARVAASFVAMEDYDEKLVQEGIDAAKEELKAAGAGPHIRGNGPSAGSSVATQSFSVKESVEAAFGFKPTTTSDDPKEGTK